MRLLDLTLPTLAENLALDEALLDEVAQGGHEVLRFWEPREYAVVLGRSSHIADELDEQACQVAAATIGRRVSGGLSIVTGPGCLMYGVALSLEKRPELRAVDRAHAYVLGRIVDGLQAIEVRAHHSGQSDLTIDAKEARLKFSGNAVRILRGALLYHGTLLYDFDLPLIAKLLKHPPRAPDYRDGRPHGEFITNIDADAPAIKTAIAMAWNATQGDPSYPAPRVEQLVAERYAQEEWTRLR